MVVSCPQNLEFGLAELGEGYSSGVISPVEVTREALRRIELANPRLRALTTVFADEALAAAELSEQRWHIGAPLSPLDGAPIVLKSTLRISGWQADFGSHNPPPAADSVSESPAVSHLRRAGAIFLGVASSPEYAWNILTSSPRFGVTYNPWDLSLGPGGSSGGTASAVAAGLAAVSPGTDAGGSVRLPAAWSGIVGFKPTHGRIALAPSGFSAIAHVGPMGRSVEDVERQFLIMQRPDSRDPYQLSEPNIAAPFFPSNLKDQRVLVLRFSGMGMPIKDHSGLDAMIDLLLVNGAHVVDEIEFDLAMVRDAWMLQYGSALGLISEGWSEEQRSMADPGLMKFAAVAGEKSALDQLKASVVARKAALDIDALLENVDFIITDAVPCPPLMSEEIAPEGFFGELWCDWASTGYLFNLTGHPAISLPVKQDNGCLPLSCQIIGRRLGDDLLLRQAKLIEEARGSIDYGCAEEVWAS